MTDSSLDVRPAIDRRPVHPSITADRISDLVEMFYGRVRTDPRLGGVFESRLAGRWEPNLAKTKRFWESVLLRTGVYKGKPVPVHVGQTQVVSEDFQIWLHLFRRTAGECFEPEAAALVVDAAERIAQSLWLAMFGTPVSAPPVWMRSVDQGALPMSPARIGSRGLARRGRLP